MSWKLSILVMLGTVVSPMVASDKLSVDELKTAIIGKTLKGEHHKMGDDFELTNNPDGTFVIHAGSKTVEGKWRFDGDRYCNQSNKNDMRKGREGCHAVSLDNGAYEFSGCGDYCFKVK